MRFSSCFRKFEVNSQNNFLRIVIWRKGLKNVTYKNQEKKKYERLGKRVSRSCWFCTQLSARQKQYKSLRLKVMNLISKQTCTLCQLFRESSNLNHFMKSRCIGFSLEQSSALAGTKISNWEGARNYKLISIEKPIFKYLKKLNITL